MNIVSAANAPWASVVVAQDHRPRPAPSDRMTIATGIVLDERARTPAERERDRRQEQEQASSENEAEQDDGSAFATALIAQAMPLTNQTADIPHGAYPEPSMGKLADKSV